jgi:DNA polymerase-3 subunit gamma/tau
MRDALSIFDQMASFTENNITYDSVIKILNVLDYEYYFKMTDLFLKGDTSESLLLFNEILYNGFDPQYFISGLAEHIRNLMLCKDTKTTALLEVSDNVAKKYELQAKQCTVNFLYQASNIINETDVQYKTSYNKRFHVELMLYKLCYINQQTPIKNADDKVKVANNVTQEKKNDNLTNVTNEPEPIKYNKEEPVLNKEVKKKEINQQKLLPSGLSIKENVIASEKADNKTKIEQIGTEPFTKQQAEKIWKNYVNLHLTDIRLKNIYLSNNDLAQWEETTLKLYVLNKSQEQIIKKLYDEMLHFFKVNLNNRNVKIEIILKDDEVKLNTPYTDKEKYDYFEKKYPLLNVIKNELNLDFM